MIKTSIEEYLEYDLNKVWDIVTNNKDYKWRSDLKEIKIIDDTKFIEVSKNGYEIEFTITAKNKNEYYEFLMDSKDSKGKWNGYFLKEDKGCRIIFTEEIIVKKFFMKILMKKFIENHQKKYMSDLKKKIEMEKNVR